MFQRLRERRRGVALLEIHAKEEFPLGRIGTDKQLTELGAVSVERAVLADRIRNIEPEFQPRGDPISEFRRAAEGMIWNDAAREIRLLASAYGVIGMRLNRQLPDFRNLGIVDLDLVGDGTCPGVSVRRRKEERNRNQPRRAPETEDHDEVTLQQDNADHSTRGKTAPWLRESNTVA